MGFLISLAEGFGKFVKAEGRVGFTTNAWFRFFMMAVSSPIRFAMVRLGLAGSFKLR